MQPPSPNSPHTVVEFPFIVSDTQLRTSVVISSILGAIAVLAFVLLRGPLRSTGGVYQRRRELQDLFLRPPKLLYGGLRQAWSWLPPVFAVSDTELVRIAGIDAMLLNRVILMGLQLFAVYTVLALGILLPTYYNFDDIMRHRHTRANVGELSKATISNLPRGHAILWLPWAATYACVGYCCWVLICHCQSYAELRMAYFQCLDAAGVQQQHAETAHAALPGSPLVGDSSDDDDAAASAPCASSGPSLTALHGSGLLGLGPVHSLSMPLPLAEGSAVVTVPHSFIEIPPPTPHFGGPLNIGTAVAPGGGSSSGSQLQLATRQLGSNWRPRPKALDANETEALLPRGGNGAGAGSGGGSGSSHAVATAAAASMGKDAATPGALLHVRRRALWSKQVERHTPRTTAARAPLVAEAAAGGLTRLQLSGLRQRYAARAHAWGNMLSMFSPIKMHLDDRADWARQQLKAEAEADPPLPRRRRDWPPAATSTCGGLLVANEDILQKLLNDCSGDSTDADQAGDLDPAVAGAAAPFQGVTVPTPSLPLGQKEQEAVFRWWAPVSEHPRLVQAVASWLRRCHRPTQRPSNQTSISTAAEAARRGSGSALASGGGGKPGAAGLEPVPSCAAQAGDVDDELGGSPFATVPAAQMAVANGPRLTAQQPSGTANGPAAAACSAPIGSQHGGGARGGAHIDGDEATMWEAAAEWWLQQQPLHVGRVNARLRQLVKVPVPGSNGSHWQLVNAHQYAVLVRDVILQPVEEFNAWGMPVTRPARRMHCGGAVDGATCGVAALQNGGAEGTAASTAGSSPDGGSSSAALLLASGGPSSGDVVWRPQAAADVGCGAAPAGRGGGQGAGSAGAGGDADDEEAPLLGSGGDVRRRRSPAMLVSGSNGSLELVVQGGGDQLRNRTGSETSQSPSGRHNAGSSGGAGTPAGAGPLLPARFSHVRQNHTGSDGGAPNATFAAGGSGTVVYDNPLWALQPSASQASFLASPDTSPGTKLHTPPPASTTLLSPTGPSNRQPVLAPPQLSHQHQPRLLGGHLPAASDGYIPGGYSAWVPVGGSCMPVPEDGSEEAAAVEQYFRHAFPMSFQRIVPVCNHRTLDGLLFQWDAAVQALGVALLAAHIAARESGEANGPLTPPPTLMQRLGSRARRAARAAGLPGVLPSNGCTTAGAVQRATARVRELQRAITAERERALRAPTRRAYVALFSSQRDAAAAAQCSLLAPPSSAQPLHFSACAAPAPEDVYWPALWTLPTGRAVRVLMAAPLVVVLLLPIGALTGAMANLNVAVCGGSAALNRLYWPWFCRHSGPSERLVKGLLTGVVPPLISLAWNAWVLPNVMYLLCAIHSRRVSLSAMDCQMSRWFYWWSLLNMFCGAVVGGSIFQQLGAYLQEPGRLLLRVGTALPTASNFFMSLMVAKGLFTNLLRVVWPHLGSMAGACARALMGAALPRGLQDVAFIHTPPGYRFAGFYNGVLQAFMVGMAYTVTAPLIAPITLVFFATAYITWRYAILYIYERQYESGGLMWPMMFDHMVGYLLVFELFTAAVLMTNEAWLQGALMWFTLTPALLVFWRLCYRRYLRPLEHPPLSVAMAAPPASVDPAVYMPPALRPGAAGWWPEEGKVWQQYGIPKYVV